ncbi:MAG: fibrobacter succinogenes major paralogous domain-containing protein [Bacteroidetes bacterium]|nr:fibrobacter succinogenes major paralogous domain-containing protein [Bacteroidota bacterium]
MGTAKLWSVPYAMAANSLSGNISKLSIAGETTDDEEALFEVKNKDGQTVFAVYNEGVRIYVDNSDKGKKGGFSIGGFANSKSSSQNLFVVDNDSIRAYIDPSPAKGKKGGFSIGGFADSKGNPEEYLLVNPDSTMVFVRKDSSENSSTFNIVAISQDLERKTLMTANPDTVNITGVLNLQNDLVVGGDIAVDGTINLVSDIEGNSYKTVKIGTQIWMAENLKTTKYNDGTSIPEVIDDATWAALITPGYCWYSNDLSSNKNVYGAQYNWYAVNTGKLCPTGWHVPNDSDFRSLILFIDPGATKVNENESLIAGGKLKEAGTTLWLFPNSGATNESGFSARPGGTRSFNGTFNKIIDNGFWWSATEHDPINGTYWSLGYDGTMVFSYFDYGKYPGFSVRCLKDN